MSEPTPTPETPAPAPRRPRRWLKILLVTVAVVVVGALVASAAYVYTIDRSVTQKIKREDVMPGDGDSARPSLDPEETGGFRPRLHPRL